MDNLYRPCVAMMVVDDHKKILVCKRKNWGTDDKFEKDWQVPQGGIESNETTEQAMRRELLEEIGTNQVKILSESSSWYYYDFPKYLEKSPITVKYKGQKQRWFLLKLDGDSSLIDLNTTEPAEFTEFRWVNYQELQTLVVDFKKEVYQKALDEFSWYFSSDKSPIVER
jgi:putative (di)nucleoside polyphosphate hydrolase